MSQPRLIITGHKSVVSSLLDRLVTQGDSTVIQVPTIGQCLSAGMKPQLWHSAMSSLMSCHPGTIVFVGGIRADQDWLIAQGALMLHVSDNLTFELSEGFSSDARRWKIQSVASLDAKLSVLLDFVKSGRHLTNSHLELAA